LSGSIKSRRASDRATQQRKFALRRTRFARRSLATPVGVFERHARRPARAPAFGRFTTRRKRFEGIFQQLGVLCPQFGSCLKFHPQNGELTDRSISGIFHHFSLLRREIRKPAVDSRQPLRSDAEQVCDCRRIVAQRLHAEQNFWCESVQHEPIHRRYILRHLYFFNHAVILSGTPRRIWLEIPRPDPSRVRSG
jgi:hypothetical protein